MHYDIERALGQAPAQPTARVRARGVKPLLRGFPDVFATALAVPAAALLVAFARPGAVTHAALVYGISLVFLFAVSATYHTPMWPVRVLSWWRRVDHAAVYVLIAGGYTPICIVYLEPSVGHALMWVLWIGAALGLVKSLAWPNAPRVLTPAIYILMGWVIAPFIPSVIVTMGVAPFVMFATGGVLYTVGGVVYARRRPNPWPVIFGYHEILHVFVVAASACHFVAMWWLLT